MGYTFSLYRAKPVDRGMLSLLNARARGEWGVVSSGAGVPSTLPLIAQSAESKYFCSVV